MCARMCSLACARSGACMRSYAHTQVCMPIICLCNTICVCEYGYTYLSMCMRALSLQPFCPAGLRCNSIFSINRGLTECRAGHRALFTVRFAAQCPCNKAEVRSANHQGQLHLPARRKRNRATYERHGFISLPTHM